MSVFYLSTRTKKDNQHQEKEIHKNYQRVQHEAEKCKKKNDNNKREIILFR